MYTNTRHTYAALDNKFVWLRISYVPLSNGYKCRKYTPYSKLTGKPTPFNFIVHAAQFQISVFEYVSAVAHVFVYVKLFTFPDPVFPLLRSSHSFPPVLPSFSAYIASETKQVKKKTVYNYNSNNNKNKKRHKHTTHEKRSRARISLNKFYHLQITKQMGFRTKNCVLFDSVYSKGFEKRIYPHILILHLYKYNVQIQKRLWKTVLFFPFTQ